MLIRIASDWEAEIKTIPVRISLVVLPLVLALIPTLHTQRGLIVAAATLAAAQILLVFWAVRSRWEGLATANYWIQLVLLILALAGSGGVAGPMTFLIYVLLIADLLWTKEPVAVRSVVINLIVSVWIGCFWASRVGFEVNWATVLLHSFGIFSITQHLIQPLRRLQLEATTDLLTGVLNRRSGLATLEHWASRNKPFALVFIDLKDFKKINDIYGHHTGDEVLVMLAQNLKRNLRGTDLLMRYGGDEFLVAAQDAGETILDRLSHTISGDLRVGRKEVRVRLNWGLVRFPEDGGSLEVLLQLADERMYVHKRESRGQITQLPR